MGHRKGVEMRLDRLRARRAFSRDEEGAATIEAVLWLPVLFYMVALSVDVTMVFHGYSRVIRVVEDVNRGISIGRIKTIDEGKAKIAANLSNYDNVESTIAIVDGVVVTNVSVPVTSLVVIGAVEPMLDKDIAVRTQQYVEF
jgi:Flp pilus assembly protein TadG